MAYAQTGWRNEVGGINSDRHGLIILGNSGVGKSFLANVLVGKEVFKHACDPDRVTEWTEYVEVINDDDEVWSIFNIPGLIESDQSRIDLNKKEIMKAFEKRPSCVVIFVFGTQKGRIRNEDLVAFHAINPAYEFRKESLAFVVNAIPKERDAGYEGKTITLLRRLVSQSLVTVENMCFLEDIDTTSDADVKALRRSLMRVVLQCEAQKHVMKQDIKVVMVELKKMEEEMRKQRVKFEQERTKYLAEITSLHHALHQAEIAHWEQIDRLTDETDELSHSLSKIKRRYKRLKKEL